MADDDPVVMRALLAACAARARERGKAFLMLGLADDDPLLAVARRWLHVTYRSDLFALSWSADPAALLDGRVPVHRDRHAVTTSRRLTAAKGGAP